MTTTASGIASTSDLGNSTDLYDVCTTENFHSAYTALNLTATGILVLCNILLLIAIVANWGVLRQNIVHRYLISCLLSSTCFCFLGAYEIYHNIAHVDDSRVSGGILQRYNRNDPTHRSVMQAWAYRKALLPCFSIVMVFNVAVLIYAIGDNTHFVGRYSEPKSLGRCPGQNEQDSKRNFRAALFKGKTLKAAFLIVGSWMAPLILSVPSAFSWNCVDHCLCLPALRSATTCISPESGVVCSRMWLPTTRSFTIVATLLYFGAIVFMFTMLVLVVRRFYKTHTPRKSKTHFTESKRRKIGDLNTLGRRNSSGGFKQAPATHSRSRSYHGTSSPTKSAKIVRFPSAREPRGSVQIFAEEDSITPTKTSADDSSKKSYSPSSVNVARTGRPPLHSTIKLSIALSLSLFVSVTPMIFIWFCDVLIYPGPQTDTNAFNTSIAITSLHSATLPFILLRYMSGLRKACVNFLLKCPCLSTTVVTKRRHVRPTTKTRSPTRESASSKSIVSAPASNSPDVEISTPSQNIESNCAATSLKRTNGVENIQQLTENSDNATDRPDEPTDVANKSSTI